VSDTTPQPSELDIIEQARANDDFRRVLITGSNMQIVVMTIPPGGEIGAETHPETDQVLFFVDGEGESVLDGERTPVTPGHLVFVRAGTHHNFINTGDTPLRVATAYAPPEHEHGTVHATKDEADAEHH
jgi:mannose-6-phosphate isomerase-like protein (cupin superfamily)